MDKQSPIVKIGLFIVFLVVAGFVLNLLLSLTGALIGLAFRIGIPLLIAYGIVRWLTNRSNSRRY